MQRVPGSRSETGQSQEAEGWYLEGLAGEGKAWFIHLQPLPFIIGRHADCQLRLSFPGISRHHAELYQRNGQLVIRDCGSLNGTFINRNRIQADMTLNSGDILHFGSQEFRVIYKQAAVSPGRESSVDGTMNIAITTGQLPRNFINCAAEFEQMLCQRAVIPHYQPIIQLIDRRTLGYELLGRGGFKGLPSSPGPLLHMAQVLGKEIQLSELFRQVGVERIQEFNEYLFVNTVPKEMDLTLLKRSMEQLQAQAPALSLVLEIHETAVTNLNMMRSLRSMLNEMEVKLAYDDFGAGQARLVELIEVPPDFLKFDIGLIRNVHEQSPRSLQVLQSLVNMAKDLGIQTLAEGVELQEGATVCTQIGFDYAQGYYFGRPSPELA